MSFIRKIFRHLDWETRQKLLELEAVFSNRNRQSNYMYSPEQVVTSHRVV